VKIAVCHDHFVKRGGGERVVIAMAKALNADIYTGFVTWEETYPELKDLPVTVLCSSLNQWKIARKFEESDLSHYDLVLCSGTWAIAASNNHPSVWYCHTPARWLYHPRDFQEAARAAIKNPILRALITSFIKPFSIYWKQKDQTYARQFDKILCNSLNVRERVKACYGEEVYRKSSVLYPPISTDRFRWLGQDNFYLSTARLDGLKRVDRIVNAFKNLPDENLVVISGGPDLEKLRKSATGFPNIQIKGWVSESQLEYLVGNCIATIYIPVDEDFGMSPVESMAAGKPCIGVREGGLKETIIHGVTGYLCENATEIELITAITATTKEKALTMRESCIFWSGNFSEQIFKEGLKSTIQEFEK
jgi:glycosyltransferase involved in cell wall biosynthesis